MTSNIMMVRPAAFGFNAETAVSNAFQQKPSQESEIEIKEAAIVELDNMVNILRKQGIKVWVMEDTSSPVKPDAIFPNNWVSFHQDGHVITYPMLVPTRRAERSQEILTQIEQDFVVKKYSHYEQFEAAGRILEGTGSIIFDRTNKVAYACTSERTDATLLVKLCEEIGYQPVSFRAIDQNGQEIYHTNVMMMIADEFAVVCMESVQDGADKLLLTQFLRTTKKVIIDISLAQMNQFAGNMLQVKSTAGQRFTVMSASAKKALTHTQIVKIESFNPIISIDIPTIEKYGGGSVRCMMAEIFLPKR